MLEINCDPKMPTLFLPKNFNEMDNTGEINIRPLTPAQVKEQLKIYRETSLSSLWVGWNHSNIQAISRRNRRLAALPLIGEKE